MEQLKAVIFDWDNTIVTSFDHLVLCHQEVGRQLDWPPVTKEQIRAVWGRPFEELVRMLWPMHDSKDFEMAYKQYILDKTVPEIEGAITTIVELKKSFLIGIVTSAPRFEVEHFLTHLGMKKTDFFVIQAAGESEHHKPDPRVFDPLIALLQEQRIGKSETIYVGDNLSDFYAARYACLQFIAVLTGTTSCERFQAVGVSSENILTSIIELPKRLGHEKFS
ncbi:MAG TPA: HAD-IA family hydrolase [Methylomirabilota bacterium]|nr:HAD-IA family hydrolase [Methylomirabilota bacterium]